MAWTYHPKEIEMVERQEHEAWLRLAEVRDRHRASGGLPPEEHELLHRLSEEWRQAMARLHAARAGRRAE